MRGYAAPNTQQTPPTDSNDSRLREFISASSPEDNNLDPVSALLKAGESSYFRFPFFPHHTKVQESGVWFNWLSLDLLSPQTEP
jgi:hypothetical protein